MSVEALIVPSFKGLRVPSRSSIRSDRRELDAPRELINFHVDETGLLNLPPATRTLIHDFGLGHAPILTVAYTENPTGLIVQTSTEIYYLDRMGPNVDPLFPYPKLVATPADPTVPIWVNNTTNATYLGYQNRGSGTSVQETWKIEYAGTAPHTDLTVTDLSATQPGASASVLYKGRRFVVGRGRTVKFSDLNAYETFGVDSEFTLSGDDAGVDFQSNPGDVQGMVSYEDLLVIFCSRSIWILTGSGPETYQLRQIEAPVGCTNQWTIARTPQGLVFLAGNHLGDLGIYLFTGSGVRKLSAPIEELFRNTAGVVTNDPLRGLYWAGRYLLSVPRTAFSRELYALNIETGEWTTFDGYDAQGPALGTRGQTLYVSDDNTLYSVDSRVPPRAPGTTGRLTLGWSDDQRPAGQARFLAVKVTASASSAQGSLSLTASVPGGGTVTTAKDIPTDAYDALVFPIKLRGHAIELDFTLTPFDDDQEVLIEHVELIVSRKGEKISRS